MSFLNGTDPGLRQIRAATTDNFAAGVDFTAGSSTQVTLTNDPGSEDNLIITFDGVTQHRNTYTVSGAVVTFDAAIGSGVSNVEATYTTTIPAATPADNSVTLAKLSDGTQGGLIYYGGSGAPTELAAGSSGQYLQTQGAGANPQWASVTSSGWEFVEKQTISGASSANFENFTSGYDYQIWGYDIVPGTDGVYLYARYGTGATPTYQTTLYSYGVFVHYSSSTTTNQSLNTSYFDLSAVWMGNAAGEIGSVRFDIMNPADTGSHTFSQWQMNFVQSGSAPANSFGGGMRKADEAVTAVQFYPTSGTISGEFFLYRRANA